MKFTTTGYVGSPPNIVCIIALPSKNLTTTLFMFSALHWFWSGSYPTRRSLSL